MKKMAVAFLALAAFCVTALTAAPAKKAKIKYGKKGGYYNEVERAYSMETEEELTPENSVLVYVYYNSINPVRLLYAQINPAKEPMLFTAENKFLSTAVIYPLAKPGSVFKLLQGTIKQGRDTWLFSTDLNLSQGMMDIQLPSEPGLYFAGAPFDLTHVSEASFEDQVEHVKADIAAGKTRLTEEKYQKKLDKLERKALSDIQREYAGTAWEPLISARLEELSK